MKITIDTKNRTISIEENVNIDDLLVELESILPGFREYTLMQKVTIWQYPYYPTFPVVPYGPSSGCYVVTCKTEGNLFNNLT